MSRAEEEPTMDQEQQRYKRAWKRAERGPQGHALAMFGFGGPWGRDWEESKTREIMDMDKERGR